MLPSTGYFKGISCPFYDSGLCERPYCHFRHVKKESQQIGNEGIESGDILQKLVSAAVQRVLQQTEGPGTSSAQPVAAPDNVTESNPTPATQGACKVTYNPTPIAELNKINSLDVENNEETNEQKKRHIPVPYTPRKPATLLVKRPVETNGTKPFIYNPPPVKYTPGSAEPSQPDLYTPKGTTESTEKYLPGTEAEIQEYKPNESQSASKHNYVPSDKTTKKKLLEYKPIKVSTKAPSVTYQPTPRSLAPCFSSDEDEPDTKKRKLSSDLNGLDELGAEFDILDQILHEEKQSDQKNKSQTESITKDDISKECKENVKTDNHTLKTSHPNKKSSDRDKSDKKEKSDKSKKHKSSSLDRKSSHKSSSRDKEKDRHKDKKDRMSSEKKKHSSSKSSSRDSKHSKGKSSKKSERSSKEHKMDSKTIEKNNHHKSHKSSKETREQEKKHEKRKEKHSSKNNIDVSDNDSNHDADFESIEPEDEVVLSESDEEAIALECKRIFEEYVPTEKTNIVKEPENKVEGTNENEYFGKKRISRTADKNVKVTARAPIKPDFKVSAAQAMAERLAKVREFHALKKTENEQLKNISTVTKPEVTKTIIGSTTPSSSKIRIAHVPYASNMLNSKKSIASYPPITAKPVPITSTTIVQTNKKGVQRVAHVPNEKFIDRPGVLEPLASKIPANIRSTYLNMMIDECLKIYLSSIDAYARAQHEELATSKKCSTVQIYKNSAVLTVSRLRKELQECNGVKKSGADCLAMQKNAQAVTGNASNSGTWSIESKNRKIIDGAEFNGAKFFKNIEKWVLTEQELQENGFPRPHPNGEKGRAMIFAQQKRKQKPPKGFFRTCCRCNKDYTVNKKGLASVKEECIYHPNNKYRIRGEVRYQCCSQDGTSDGCCVAPSHVYEYVDYENLRGYMRTMPPESVKDDYGVYALDCEMCYTTQGLDLTRITVINSECKVVYETLIKPLHPIVDYNTRYSGITEEQMSDVQTTLLDVQATLLAMFSSKTILIGHSLESDFKALKLIHDTVIDTSVLYPHKMGPPFKRALRNLTSEYLKKIIQNSVDGHDSAEDATVCMELIQHKLKEDLKTR